MNNTCGDSGSLFFLSTINVSRSGVYIYVLCDIRWTSGHFEWITNIELYNNNSPLLVVAKDKWSDEEEIL